MIVSDVDREIKDRKMQTLQSLLTSSSSATKAKQNSSTPGQIIDGVRSTDGFLKGHGTQVSDGFLRSTVSGVIERVNKLVSVKALKAKYNPETGDVVIGRIIMIAQKRWRVDINSRQDAVLQLSSVNLPSGQQRRRNEADELNMSRLFDSSDVISAEVQSLFQDGAANLHDRSTKYGRLSKGMLVEVCPNLVKRLPQHFHALEVASGIFVEVLIGCNGFIWVGSPGAATNKKEQDSSSTLSINNELEVVLISKTERENIVRIANCIRVLDKLFFHVTPQAIMNIYNQAVGLDAKDILNSDAFLARVIQTEIEMRTVPLTSTN